MSYRPVELPRFGGLVLNEDAQAVGWNAAVDLLNVDFDRRGRIRQRSGSSTLYTDASITGYGGVAIHGDDEFVVAGSGGGATPCLRAVSDAGVSLATQNGTGSTNWSFARIGGPSGTYLYCCGGNELWYYDGSVFAVAAADTYSPAQVGLQTADNRLMVTDSNHRVRFSNAGDPETFGTDDYVDLTPGDGEVIRAIVAWRDMTFVFKQTKYFVFYGNSTDSVGGAVFNYRPVTGNGISTPQIPVAGPDGVYFADTDGIYRTSGGPAQKVSAVLDPLFTSPTEAEYWEGTTVALSGWAPRFGWFAHRLYASFFDSAGTAGVTFVWDPATDIWTCWSLPISGFAARLDEPSLYFTTFSDEKLRYFNESVTTDSGVNMVSRYRTGFADLGSPGQVKTMREVTLDGIGTVDVFVMTNDGITRPTAVSVVLGTTPQVGTGRVRNLVYGRGRNFSVQVTGPPGDWLVSRIVAHMREERTVGRKGV